jgi:glutamate carboxypeptidase
MYRYLDCLKWIDSQESILFNLVDKWANINSGSDNLAGLAQMLSTLQDDFAVLKGKPLIYSLPARKVIGKQGQAHEVPLGQALSFRKRPQAPIQVFLGGHMDTVFSISHPFQKTERLDQDTLRGPGVADLKGGLAILLKAMEAFEKSSYADQIGWEIFFNPDEEIGSIGSAPLFKEAAKHYHVGLIFEPSFADGAFVSKRKGSANLTVIAKGKAAHAGRDFHVGRSSIYAIAHLIREIETLNQNTEGTTLNVGQIEGGGPVNIVPDLAICRINIRAKTADSMFQMYQRIHQIIEICKQREGIQLDLIEDYFRLPKPYDPSTQDLFEKLKACADQLDLPFLLRESGGVCDGNILAEGGLPTLDSVGAIGGKIHTDEEYVSLPSLTQRAKLICLFLLKLASYEIELPVRIQL